MRAGGRPSGRWPAIARYATRVLLVASLAGLCACAHLLAPAPARDETGIRRQREAFNQLIAYRDMKGLGALLADDVQLVTPAKTVGGRRNLVRNYEGLLKQRPDLVSIFTTERVERNPRWKFAAESGRWLDSWQHQGEATEVAGSYYAIWMFRDGRWRLHSQTVTPLSCKGPRYCKSLE